MKNDYEIIEGYIENTLENFIKKINIDEYDAFFIHA